MLPTVQLNLHEERLTRLAAGPVVAVVDRLIPLEVVIRLAECVPLRVEAADAGVVTGFLEEHRHGHDALRKVNLLDSATATVMMRANRRLIATGNHRGAARRAHRRRHE